MFRSLSKNLIELAASLSSRTLKRALNFLQERRGFVIIICYTILVRMAGVMTCGKCCTFFS